MKKTMLYVPLGIILVLSSVFVVHSQVMTPAEQVALQKQQILETSGILPGELFAFEGEELFYSSRGPNDLSMEGCDFGLGEGVVEGAYAQLPRYFSDTDRVQDVDSRIITCMTETQGFAKDDINRAEVVSIASFISMQSQGYEQAISLEHEKEQAMFDIGEQLFYSRAAVLDMSCAICHEDNAGKRIRLQGLGDVKADAVATHWPAYRFGSDRMWTMEDRLRGCFSNVGVPKPSHYSDALIALQVYMSYQANGVEIDAPGFVR